MAKNFNWDADSFFRNLHGRNKLASAEGFTYCRVSGLEGFEEAVQNAQESTAFFCLSDISDGYTTMGPTPHTRRIKTVFLAMRHAPWDMDARERCMDTMRELFRQVMSVLIQEKTRLEQNKIYMDSRISFKEIPQHFFSGCAAAYFQVAVDTFTDLRYNGEEWTD